MLRDTFYRVLSREEKDSGSFSTLVSINKDHEIFKGHFPTIPVVPGVCMMQMVKELLQEKVNKKLTLNHAGILKFLSLINPLETQEVEIEVVYSLLEDGAYKADSTIRSGEITFFKINKAVYR